MIGLTSLELYNCLFNVTEENIPFHFFIFAVSKKGRITYEKVRHEIEKDLDISDITATDSHGEIFGPIFLKNIKRSSKKDGRWSMYENFSRLY